MDTVRVVDEPVESFEIREESQADDLLGQAFEAFAACGDRQRLGLSRSLPKVKDESRALSSRLARRRVAAKQRISFARASILFSALAGEASINHFLYLHLRQRDVEGLDTLPPVEKYLVGPVVALGESLFARSEEPTGRLTRLYKLRNELVHPKTKTHRVERGKLLGESPKFQDFNPQAAGEFLVAVAQASEILASPKESKYELGGWGKAVLEHREPIAASGKEWRKSLPKSPPSLEAILRRIDNPTDRPSP